MKKWILGLGAALLAAALWILGRDARQLRRTEAQRDALLATGANEHKKKDSTAGRQGREAKGRRRPRRPKLPRNGWRN